MSQAIHYRGRSTLRVAPGEDDATGGGEAQAEDDATIDVGGIVDDFVVEDADGLGSMGRNRRSIMVAWSEGAPRSRCRWRMGSRAGSGSPRDPFGSYFPKPATDF